MWWSFLNCPSIWGKSYSFSLFDSRDHGTRATTTGISSFFAAQRFLNGTTDMHLQPVALFRMFTKLLISRPLLRVLQRTTFRFQPEVNNHSSCQFQLLFTDSRWTFHVYNFVSAIDIVVTLSNVSCRFVSIKTSTFVATNNSNVEHQHATNAWQLRVDLNLLFFSPLRH